MASDITLYDSTGNPVIVTGDEMKEFISYPPPIGVGQTWQDVTASREFDVVYTNDTGRPIMVSIRVDADNTTRGESLLKVDGFQLGCAIHYGEVTMVEATIMNVIVPANSTYQCELGYTSEGVQEITKWMELR